MSDVEITRESIRKGLADLGVQKGDRIVMHSSLSTIARASVLAKLPNCGADFLVDALLDLIGYDGLLCVPTFTKTFIDPSVGPVGQIFDPAVTPSRVGSITNIVRTRPGAVRSLHPTHSWAAVGKESQEFVKGHENTSTFGRDSICGRMYDWDFKILWFGTTGTTNTSTHFAEDWLDLPYMTSEDAMVKDGDGWRRVTVYRSPKGPRDFYKNGCKLDKALENWNLWTRGKVHNATVTIMKHRDFMNRLVRGMIEDPCLLLADGRDDPFHQLYYRLNPEFVGHLKRKHGGTDGIMKMLKCGG
jgi:aminoglycoside 3-N-acetyltransferase